MSVPLELEPDGGEACDEVAIVGMAGRFPGAADLDEFWRHLRDGVTSISFFTDEELLAAGAEPALLADPRHVRARGVLAGVELFDAPFFGFSPREAAITDPQHRVFLECAWEALEQAGVDAATFPGRIGVYAGSVFSTYLLSHLLPRAAPADESWQMVLANDKDTLATRVSYKLGLRGPSVSVQTACSTSLVAVHIARQSLLDYECDLALAGGVAIRSPQTVGYLYQEEGILSPDGCCRAFDAGAQGTVFSSGAGVVVLKRLSEARADGDTIHAVLKGSAINNDGSLKIGFTAPSVDGQAEVIARALSLGGVHPETVSYVEAHGTGTALGDPIEIAGLTRAFRSAGAEKRGFCAVGSVKTNIGHLDCAAGIAGLIKTVLALEHRQIPPSLHFERPNPRLGLAESPFYVSDRLRPWPGGAAPRRAGVSSFGIGGTNAHVVVEEAPPAPPTSPSRPWQLLVLSAKTDTALTRATARLAEHLRQRPEQDLSDVAHTLQVGRRALPWRRALVCSGREDALEALAGRDRLLEYKPQDGSPAVAFLFPGQGSQRASMAGELYRTEAFFRREVDRSCEILRPHLGEDLRDLLFPAEDRRQEAERRLKRTAVAQPALFVVEAALARLWMSWGVRPQAMLGHSIGEYVAAHLAGVFSLEDALALVAARGRLIEELPGGAMLAVPLSESEVVPLLGREISLAAVNGPSQCVVAGSEQVVEELRRELAARGVEGRRLATSHAFHSRQMEPAIEPFVRRLGQVPLRPPEIPFLSNVTGRWAAAGEVDDPAYWARHLRQTVRFSEGLTALLAEPGRVLLEVGPGRALTRLARRHGDLLGTGERVAVASLDHAGEGESEVAALLTALGRLWAAGVPVDWAGFSAGERRRHVPLPTYPFERSRHWVELARPGRAAGQDNLPEPSGDNPAEWFHLPSWRRSLPPSSQAAGQKAGCWLVFVDGCGLGEELAQRLERTGRGVVRIAAAEGGNSSDGRVLRLDPRCPDEYASLLLRLRQEGRQPCAVLHLWSLTQEGEPAPDFEQSQSLGFRSLSALTRALVESGCAGMTVTAISNGVQRVTGQEDLCPAKATLLGWVRSAPLAAPLLRCRSLDIILPEPGSLRRARLAERLLAEVQSEASEPVVAYRGDDRWIPAREPAPLSAADRPGAWVRPAGNYLITGGLDGVAFAMARRLATTGVRLALVAPPELGPGDSREAVRTLEDLGSEVLILEAELSAGEPMRRALAQAEEAWGPLHGVFYLPGRGGPAEWMQGALLLDSLLGNERPLDFFVLFSWLEPPPAIRSQPEIWAASALLDALAQQRTARGASPTVTIDWGPGPGFGTEEAFEAFDRVMGHLGVPQIAVSAPQPARQAAPGPSPETATAAILEARTDDIPAEDPIASRIAAVWRQALGMDRVGLRDHFFDLGGDSLIALQVMARLRSSYPVDLPVQIIFDRPTVSGLRQAIEEALTAKIEELPEEEAQRLIDSFIPPTTSDSAPAA